jgi:hypothetical protein
MTRSPRAIKAIPQSRRRRLRLITPNAMQTTETANDAIHNINWLAPALAKDRFLPVADPETKPAELVDDERADRRARG